MRTAGLSIIELLMVIAIIGILSTVVLASLNESRAEAHDILRISQLKEVEKALVSYYFENNTYPVGDGILSVEATEIAPAQINDLPNDPFFTGTDCAVSGHNYCYAQIDGGEGYVLTLSLIHI